MQQTEASPRPVPTPTASAATRAEPDPDLEVIRTEDGTTTLRRRGTEVSYRSIVGAGTESEVVFVGGTLLRNRPRAWRVVELGFGAATNFSTVVRAAADDGVQVEYWAVEREPVPPELVCAEGKAARVAAEALRRARAGEGPIVTVHGDALTLHLVVADWIGAPLPGDADAVFFDPFGPGVEPESWISDAFAVAASCLSDAGVLATYSAATAVRKAMVEAGLAVASLPGPGRKREVTVAALSPEAVAHGRPVTMRV